MAYQKDQFFYKKLLNIFTYKKTPLPRLARLVLLEMAKHCDKDGVGEAFNDAIGKPLGVHKDNIPRFTKGFSALKILTKTVQYQKRSQNMTQNKFQIHLEIMLELTLDQNGEITIDHKPYIYAKKPVDIEENTCTKNMTSHHGNGTPSHHGDGVKLISSSRTETKQTPKLLNIVQEQNLITLPTSLFERFWAAYPRKQNRIKASAVWQRNNLDEIGVMIIQDVLQRSREDIQWQNKEFIPHATSYLNGERWNDEILGTQNNESTQAGTPPPRRSKTSESIIEGIRAYEKSRERSGR